MSDTVTVEYVGIHDEVHIPALGIQSAVRGVPLEVSAEAAGRGPSGDDLGEGLLAQVGNWQLAKPAKSAPKDNA